jgi:tetratricopeptide (TPR) repeat protein
MRTPVVAALAVILLTNVGLSFAQQSSTPSAHGHMGDVNQAAILGQIDFPTAATKSSHAAFVRGVLLLHNFHYPQAAEAFREAQHLDSGDVMGYWGEAMTYTHPVWNEQDTAAADSVLRRLAPTHEARLAKVRTARERQWLEAVETLYAPTGTKAQRDTAYAAAMARVHESDPRDVEASTLYALALLGLNQGDRDVATYQKAYQLLAPIFATHPHHPGAAHYLIHATDDPQHAALGLAAAEAYSSIAPSATHAIHMTSHIFLALGKWDDVVAANVRAQSTMPANVLNPHIVHWLHYGFLQQGRYHEADRWLDSMARQVQGRPNPRRAVIYNSFGLMAGANLIDSHRWNGSAGKVRVDGTQFDSSTYTAILGDLAASEFGVALGALFRGEDALVDSTLAQMASQRASSAGDINSATGRGMSEVMEKTLRGYVLQKRGDQAGALNLFRDAAKEEAALPMPFGPPMTIKPPREAAGELLLEIGKPDEARDEFILALNRTPRRTAPLLGLARAEWTSGRRDESRKHYHELLGIWHSADADLPELAEVRSRSR